MGHGTSAVRVKPRGRSPQELVVDDGDVRIRFGNFVAEETPSATHGTGPPKIVGRPDEVEFSIVIDSATDVDALMSLDIEYVEVIGRDGRNHVLSDAFYAGERDQMVSDGKCSLLYKGPSGRSF